MSKNGETHLMNPNQHDDLADFDVSPVGPFTGFGNFLRKELKDWWKSWRLIIIFVIPTLIMTLEVFFAFEDRVRMIERFKADGESQVSKSIVATFMLLQLFQTPMLFVIIIIFSTMGILTNEKSTGTLAWNLTKPLGRTGLFVAKWLAATMAIWVAMCVLPVVTAGLCLSGFHGVQPQWEKMWPIVVAAFAWIGFWVLLGLTISLGFQSQAAVAGITFGFWIVPNLFGLLMGEVLGKETRDWILDRFAPNAPFWSYELLADKDLFFFAKKEAKNVWYYAFAAWTIVLSVFSLRVFNRQEIGA